MKTLKILISVFHKIYFERFDIDIYLNFFDKIQIYHIHEGINFKKDKIFNHRKNEIFKSRSLLINVLKLLFINKGLFILIIRSRTKILYFKNYIIF